MKGRNQMYEMQYYILYVGEMVNTEKSYRELYSVPLTPGH